MVFFTTACPSYLPSFHSIPFIHILFIPTAFRSYLFFFTAFTFTSLLYSSSLHISSLFLIPFSYFFVSTAFLISFLQHSFIYFLCLPFIPLSSYTQSFSLSPSLHPFSSFTRSLSSSPTPEISTWPPQCRVIA